MPGFGHEPVDCRKVLCAMQVVNADVLGIYFGAGFSSRSSSFSRVACMCGAIGRGVICGKEVSQGVAGSLIARPFLCYLESHRQ